jgi:hypothetical protein
MANPEDKVVVGYCSPGTVDTAFHESLLNLIAADAVTTHRIIGGGGRISVQASANISGARNDIVRQFLDHSDAEWLWMLDTDMTFPAETLEALLENADPDRAPIVGALCFGLDDGWLFPTLYDLRPHEESPVVRYREWPPNAMFQVAATGAACMLIHRTVLAKIRDQAGAEFSVAFPWYQEREHGVMKVGEDVTFCLRAGLCGFPVYVNTGVAIGHIKSHTLTVDGYLAQQAFKAGIAESEEQS